MFWTKSAVLALIAEYKKYEVLYNTNLDIHNDRVEKRKACHKIAKYLSQTYPEINIAEVQKKLLELKSHYVKKLERIKDSVAVGPVYKPKAFWFDKMSFLNEYIKISEGKSSQDGDEHNFDEHTLSQDTFVSEQLSAMTKTEESDSQSESFNLSESFKVGPTNTSLGSQEDPSEVDEGEWSNAAVVTLIQEWKKYEFLYNDKLPKFRDVAAKDKAFAEIAKSLNGKYPHIRGDAVKRKTASLRSYYAVNLQRINKSIIKNGKYGTGIYKPTVFWFNKCSFLNAHMKLLHPGQKKNKPKRIKRKYRLKGEEDELSDEKFSENVNLATTNWKDEDSDDMSNEGYSDNLESTRTVHNPKAEVFGKISDERYSDNIESTTTVHNEVTTQPTDYDNEENVIFIKNKLLEGVDTNVEDVDLDGATSQKELRDEIAAFLEYVNVELQKFSDEELFDEAQIKIRNIIYECKCKQRRKLASRKY